MSWDYQYTPYIWPGLATAAFDAALCLYSWRHRRVPGATAFAFYLAAAAAWSVFDALELAGADLPTKLLWAKFAGSAKLLLPVTGFFFALEYAGLGRWLTRRTLVMLILPVLIAILMAFSNEAHHLTWTNIEFGERLILGRGPTFLPSMLYSYLLYLVAMAVFVWLFARSPLHRWPVAIILIGQLAPRGAFLVDTLGRNPLSPLDLSMVLGNVAAAGYAIALFRFHLFDVVPVGRETVLERMVDGMLVLDAQGRVADLNPAAQELLGTARGRVLGRDGALVLAAFPDLARLARDPSPSQVDVLLGTSGSQCWYQASSSPLTDRRGFQLGRLMLFHDLTELRRTQQQMLEQQRALATLDERERVARELHDGLGQVLGYVKLQAQAARELIPRDPSTADTYLEQLVAVAQDAHTDVREYLLGSGDGATVSPGFLASLERYLERYRQHYGIAANLCVQPGLDDEALAPTVAVQLLRIVQEALNNIRKHAQAGHVRVELGLEDTMARVIVADDGVGFDPAGVPDEGQSFGLRFMRERAEQVGGRVELDSAPGQGTRVVVRVPRQALAAAKG